jgi:hypothetical protein
MRYSRGVREGINRRKRDGRRLNPCSAHVNGGGSWRGAVVGANGWRAAVQRGSVQGSSACACAGGCLRLLPPKQLSLVTARRRGGGAWKGRTGQAAPDGLRDSQAGLLHRHDGQRAVHHPDGGAHHPPPREPEVHPRQSQPAGGEACGGLVQLEHHGVHLLLWRAARAQSPSPKPPTRSRAWCDERGRGRRDCLRANYEERSSNPQQQQLDPLGAHWTTGSSCSQPSKPYPAQGPHA